MRGLLRPYRAAYLLSTCSQHIWQETVMSSHAPRGVDLILGRRYRASGVGSQAWLCTASNILRWTKAASVRSHTPWAFDFPTLSSSSEMRPREQSDVEDLANMKGS